MFTVEGDTLNHACLTKEVLACTENGRGETHLLIRYRDRRSVGGINFFNRLYVTENRLAWREVPRPSSTFVNVLAQAHKGTPATYRRVEYVAIPIQHVLPDQILRLA